MHPATLEKALHKWPSWEATILEARSELKFDPAVFEVEKDTKEWQRDVGWDKAVEKCFEAMSKMELPWYFGFYWMACFCADYRSGQSVDYWRIKVPPQDISEAWSERARERFVKDRGTVILLHEGGANGKLYPPYPFLIETPFLFGLDRGERPPSSERYGTMEFEKDGKPCEVSGVFDIDEGGFVSASTNGSITREVCQIKVPVGTYAQILFGERRSMPPSFTVEFPMFLATEDVVGRAFKQIQVYREGFRHYISHPLLTYVEQVKAEPDKCILEQMRGPRQDIDRYVKGELTYEELIQREWQRELAREGPMVLWLKDRHMGLSEARTTVYHRVRRRLVRAGIPPPKPKKGWRSALELIMQKSL